MNHHHDHDHDHHHHHPHPETSEMSMEEKIARLLDHWMQHNEEHAKSYETWAEKAKSSGFAQVDALLHTAAEKTRAVNEHFKAAVSVLKGESKQ